MSLDTSSVVLNFTILDTHDPLLLGVMDLSFYPSSFTITNPTLEITPPGFNKKVLSYTTKALNFFNSNDLGLTCSTQDCALVALPDGLWQIKMTVSPPDQYNLTKSFLNTLNIQRTFGNAVMKTDISQCNDQMKKQQMEVLDEIWYYIQCAIGAANSCNYTVAMELYRQAYTMLKDFIECKPNYYTNRYYLYGG